MKNAMACQMVMEIEKLEFDTRKDKGELTMWWDRENLRVEWEDSKIARALLTRARAWTRASACMRLSISALRFLTMWPLTSA